MFFKIWLKSPEFNRKLLHIIFAGLVYILANLDQNKDIVFMAVLAVFTIGGDIATRRFLARHPQWSVFKSFSKIMYRKHERSGRKRFSGGTWLMISSLIVVVCFDKTIFVPAMLLIAFADTLSAMIGKKYGNTKLFGTNKSLEGMLGFLLGGAISWIFIATFLPSIKINLLLFCISVLVASLCEFIKNMDDNFTIIIGYSVSYFTLSYLINVTV